MNIFVNSLKKDYVENGKVEFSSTVKPFYDRNIKTHEICFAAGKRNFVNKSINVSSRVSLRRKPQFAHTCASAG